MILSGRAIEKSRDEGKIVIEPFQSSHLNPNSYNFRLADTLLRAMGDTSKYSFERIALEERGFVLQPKTLYLGATFEVIGSIEFAMTLLGRSSLGRLGLFLNITADLGHVGAVSQWTLGIVHAGCATTGCGEGHPHCDKRIGSKRLNPPAEKEQARHSPHAKGH